MVSKINPEGNLSVCVFFFIYLTAKWAFIVYLCNFYNIKYNFLSNKTFLSTKRKQYTSNLRIIENMFQKYYSEAFASLSTKKKLCHIKNMPQKGDIFRKDTFHLNEVR